MSERPAATIAVDERLPEGARRQRQASDTWCTPACAWYHGPRLYLRALGVLTGARRDSAFLLDAIGARAAVADAGRVLVPGAADTGILAHVVAAYAAAGRAPRVTVVDRCGTPLATNAWYAGATGVQATTTIADVLEYRSPEPFDLIAAHSFFSHVADADRPRLVQRWYDLLRPGGALVTVHGIYATDDQLARAQATRAQTYRDRVDRLDEAACASLGVDRRTVRAWVDAGIAHMQHRPVRSVEDLRGLFERQGFRLARLAVVPGATASRVSLVAERPA